VTTVVDACRTLLLTGSLAAKRRLVDGISWDGDGEGSIAGDDITAPARDGALALVEGSEKLPPLAALANAEARVQCLSRFAHHELMATELFAWALVRFPRAPRALRVGWLSALVEEQQHLELYLERLAAHGAALGDVPLSGYFWKLMPGVRDAADPLRAFLCMQGLTLEQANLDFTMLYRDAFRRAGDEETAAVLQRVHDDEIAHVRLAHVWLTKDAPVGASDVDAYVEHVPFPLSAARAKGRRFEVGARRRAGLSEEFIAHVRDAKPYERASP
jgi:uncharacterized ferritin-like protein (DUF455 family)